MRSWHAKALGASLPPDFKRPTNTAFDISPVEFFDYLLIRDDLQPSGVDFFLLLEV